MGDGNTIYKDNSPTDLTDQVFMGLLGINPAPANVPMATPQKSGELSVLQSLFSDLQAPYQTNDWYNYGNALIQNSSNPIYKYSYDPVNGEAFKTIDYNKSLISKAAQSILGGIVRHYGEKEAQREQQEKIKKLFEATQITDPVTAALTGSTLAEKLLDISPQAAIVQRIQAAKAASQLGQDLFKKKVGFNFDTERDILKAKLRGAPKAAGGEPLSLGELEKAKKTLEVKMDLLNYDSGRKKEIFDLMEGAKTKEDIKEINSLMSKQRLPRMLKADKEAITKGYENADMFRLGIDTIDKYMKDHPNYSYAQIEIGNLLPWSTEENKLKAMMDYIASFKTIEVMGKQGISDKDINMFRGVFANTKNLPLASKLMKKAYINTLAKLYVTAKDQIPASGKIAEIHAKRAKKYFNEPETARFFWKDFIETDNDMLPTIRELYDVKSQRARIHGRDVTGFIVPDFPDLGVGNPTGTVYMYKKENGKWALRPLSKEKGEE